MHADVTGADRHSGIIAGRAVRVMNGLGAGCPPGTLIGWRVAVRMARDLRLDVAFFGHRLRGPSASFAVKIPRPGNTSKAQAATRVPVLMELDIFPILI